MGFGPDIKFRKIHARSVNQPWILRAENGDMNIYEATENAHETSTERALLNPDSEFISKFSALIYVRNYSLF